MESLIEALQKLSSVQFYRFWVIGNEESGKGEWVIHFTKGERAMTRPHLILYSKPGCHLCEGLQEKLEQVETIDFVLEVRDITKQEDWFQAFQYEIPVLMVQVDDREKLLPRPSPRANVHQLTQMLQKYLVNDPSQ